jgi:hypothetical protein
MRDEAMVLARRGFSADEIRRQMTAWCTEATERAVAWAAAEDARMEAAWASDEAAQ